MIIEPRIFAARGSLIEPSEVNILVDLIHDSSDVVRLNILDTLTHLPLPEKAWDQVRTLIRQELLEAQSFEDKAVLLEIGTWVPHGFDLEDEVRRTDESPYVQKKLLDAVRQIRRYYPIREDFDREWAASPAPGFELLSQSELLTRKSQLQSEVSLAALKLSNWRWTDESLPDIAIEDPVLTTLLFELAAKDDWYNIGLTNNLVAHIAGLSDFRPDLYGLFREYLRCVDGWIVLSDETNGRWFQLRRDDESVTGWRSWQIAWTVSRGGLKGLIPALATYLIDDDETHQIAALALIADSADYALQRSPALFGGGIRPPRFDPSQTHGVWLQDVKEKEPPGGNSEVGQVRAGEEVEFTAYHPVEVTPNQWYVLLAYVHVANAMNVVHEDSQTRLGDQFKEYRGGHGTATEAIVRGAEIAVVPELPGCRFNPPTATLLWLEDWHRIEFRMQASEELPGFAHNAATDGRISFYVGPILVAEIILRVRFSDDVHLVNGRRMETASTAKPFQAVFVSYSHKDTRIVQELEKAYTALGLSYLRDVNVLRSGEEWNSVLLKKIDEAEIFQLCWSHNAEKSRYVEDEWRHALGLQRQSFIRPIYWEMPMPKPPEELANIHFAYLPSSQAPHRHGGLMFKIKELMDTAKRGILHADGDS